MSETQRPNILYLHGDGAGRFVETCGHAVPTPHLTRLAREGVSFRNSFCTAPSCSPSRASLHCGNSISSNGMQGLSHRGWWFKDESHTLVEFLNGAGYTTLCCGSTDFIQLDWDHKLTNDSTGYGVVASACDYLHNKRGDEPFFMSVGFGPPKGRQRIGPPPGVEPVDRNTVRAPLCFPDTPETREDWARQIDATRTMDYLFGQVLDALDASGLSDNTLVIATTDHGPSTLGMKGALTDHGLGCFLVMRGPGGFTGGQCIDALTSQIDLFPTICDVIGVDTPDWVEGASLLPLVRGERDRIHEAIFGELTYHWTYSPSRTVRSERYRYIRRYHDNAQAEVAQADGDSGIKDALIEAGATDRTLPREALSDLAFDPNEATNVADNPSYADVLDDMRRRLDEQMQRVNDPLLDGDVPLPDNGACNDPSDYRRQRNSRLSAEDWNQRLGVTA